MRKIFIPIILTLSAALFAQEDQEFKDSQLLKSFNMYVSHAKTVNLIFPSAIQAVDLGSKDIIADKFEDVENVLRVKSRRKKAFEETNLSVVTKDGKYYSFHVNYSKKPKIISYQLGGNDFSGVSKTFLMKNEDRTLSPVTFDEVQMNRGDMAHFSREVIKKERKLNHIRMKEFNMTFGLRALYIKDNVTFWHFRIENKSKVSYDIDFVKFYIRDKKVKKQTSIQEIEVHPLYVYPEVLTVKGRKRQDMVFALQKFTIPNDKTVMVELFEKTVDDI